MTLGKTFKFSASLLVSVKIVFCSNYGTIVLISHASKVMPQILPVKVNLYKVNST